MITRRHPLVQLLADPLESFCGFVYSMTYETARVLTNDHWKERVGGIPQNCFLVGAAFDAEHFTSAHAIDQQAYIFVFRGRRSCRRMVKASPQS